VIERRDAAAAILATMLAALGGCANRAGDCHDNGNCGGAHPSESTSSAGGQGGHGGATASSSTGPPPNCTGDPSSANINEACAVFVAEGATGTEGTRTAPLGDLGKAVEVAGASGKRVYACGNFDGPLVPTKGFDLWGGFQCKVGGWTWSGANRSKLAASADVVPVVADVSGAVAIHTFSITAASASAASSSSIAVVFGKQVDPTIDRCDLTAGRGATGGTTSGSPMQGAAANPPMPGTAACGSSTTAKGGQLTCPDGSILKGGDGGDGGTKANPNGTKGGNGTIDGMAVTFGGAGGIEGGALCFGGEPGKSGKAGVGGDGGVASDTSVDVASKPNGFPTGVVTVGGGAGNKGSTGAPGQPGAGGGGAAHTPSCRGGVGGAGMSGGCGGGGGLPGLAGGSAIGVICLGTRLELLGVDIVVGDGGLGGPGGAGGTGGSGAVMPPMIVDGKSTGASTGCSGAEAGTGGPGGDGGGGRGGHAMDVVFMTTPTNAKLGPMSTWMFGAPGGGGVTTGLNPAEPGLAALCWNFQSDAACP
jgi:hypothetical protein